MCDEDGRERRAQPDFTTYLDGSLSSRKREGRLVRDARKILDIEQRISARCLPA